MKALNSLRHWTSAPGFWAGARRRENVLRREQGKLPSRPSLLLSKLCAAWHTIHSVILAHPTNLMAFNVTGKAVLRVHQSGQIRVMEEVVIHELPSRPLYRRYFRSILAAD